MEQKAVQTDHAPKAIGPYSQAVRAGSLLYLSGQIGLDPASGQMVGGDVATQMRQVLKNIAAVLEAGGSGIDRVVKSTIYLRRMSDFPEVNAIYGEAFQPPYPARATVAVAGLPLDAEVEMDVIAVAD
jgi:2-iminobutanoate/2-iminopropanoate deaminase